MKIMHRTLVVAIGIGFLTLAPYGNARAILTLTNSGWGNTSDQTTPPAAFIMSVGFCVTGPNCNPAGAGMSNLNPLTFYPSHCRQKVRIYSGPAFDAIVSVFSQSGDLTYWVPRVLSNDGSVPSDFFQKNQSNGGSVNVGPATTVKFIEIVMGSFSFKQLPGGYWEAEGSDGNPPPMNITVYGY
jgi:hypothetical protein